MGRMQAVLIYYDHLARFDVTDGRATCLPAVAPVRVYPVRVENGEIQIQID